MLLASLALSVAASAAPIDHWCTHGLDNVFRDSPPGAAREVRAAGARGQTVGAQIVLRATAEGVRVERLAAGTLRRAGGPGAIGPRAFTCAFVEYYRVAKNSTATPPDELLRKAPADFPDAFLEAPGVDLVPGANQPAWVAWRIPRNAPAGDYLGEVRVATSKGDSTVPVRLTVYDFVLPRPDLLVTIWVNTESLAKHQHVAPGSDAYWELVRRTARLMRAHHQNVILTPWNLIAARREEGRVRFDFARFDRWVRTFLDEDFERIEIAHVGGREHGQWEDRTFVAWPMPCDDPATGKQEQLPPEEWLPALEAHLRERGWLARSMLHVADEPIPVNVDSWRELSRRVRRAAPSLRRIDAVHVPDLSGDLEVWVPQLNYLKDWEGRFRAARQTGVELWYYTAWVPQGHFPNRLMDYALAKTRVLHWLNYLTGTTGYLHWGFNFWDVPFDQFAPGDNFIVWPGKRAPRSSLRYEAMREGIEDYAYLRLLEGAGDAAARRLRVSAPGAGQRLATQFAHLAVRGYEDYDRAGPQLYAARDAIARAIVGLRDALPLAVAARRTAVGVALAGFTAPGSTVTCSGRAVVAAEDGAFTLDVEAAHEAEIEVEVVSGGKRGRQAVPVVP